uniref:Fibronectin type-III domain-containing protein n=1 Tax=Parascaris equorum TaxID=6256 RepID=A0A914RSI8_PAREQ
MLLETFCALIEDKICSNSGSIFVSESLDSLDEWDENRTDHSIGRRVLFDRLIPFTRYRARVRANNVKGEGPYSDWTTFQTLPASPPQPTDLVEERSFPHAIEISFLPPSPPYGNTNEYRIRHTPAGQSSLSV